MAALLLIGGFICRFSLTPGAFTPVTPTSQPTATDRPQGTAVPSREPTPEASPADAGSVDAMLSAISQERMLADVQALSAIHTRHVNSETISLAAEHIYREFLAAGGTLEVSYDWFEMEFGGVVTQQRNVVARLPGEDRDAGVILIGAHYDSRAEDVSDALARAPGANDNATGVAVLLELARLTAGLHPQATILFVAFSAEEVGMQGSRHFVQAAHQDGWDLRATLVLDIVGNSAGAAGRTSIRAFSAPPSDSPSRRLAEWVSQLAGRRFPAFEVLVQETVDRPGRYSDHVPFSEAAIPSVRLIEPIEHPEFQHNAQDLPSHIDSSYMPRVAELALVVLVELAEDPSTFLRDG